MVGRTTGGLGLVWSLSRKPWMPSRKSGRGQESLPMGREGSGGPPGGPWKVGRTSQRTGSGREASRRARRSERPTWRLEKPSRNVGVVVRPS